MRARNGVDAPAAALIMAAAGVVCALFLISSSSVPTQRAVVLKQMTGTSQLADIWDSYKDNEKGGTYGSISYGTGQHWHSGSQVPAVLDCGPMANECNVNPTGSDAYATRQHSVLKSRGPAWMQSLAEADGKTAKKAQGEKRKQRQPKMSAEEELEVLEDGMHGDSGVPMDNIQQYAAYKVNRWMGGGYEKVYDLGSGR